MESEQRNSGIGFWGLLQIVFIVLKLCGAISWTWFQVFLPFVISAGVVIIVLIIATIVMIIDNHKYKL